MLCAVRCYIAGMSSPSPLSTPPSDACVRVLFDGSCPVCSREIAMYQGLTPRTPIAWVDVSQPGQDLPKGKSPQQLMSRFHVVTRSGEVVDGARAFVHLWQQLPRWRYLAGLAQLPGVVQLMELAYGLFLRWRPTVQRWFKRA
jgi:3-demethoxyubiquinol 3-hydroxylase